MPTGRQGHPDHQPPPPNRGGPVGPPPSPGGPRGGPPTPRWPPAPPPPPGCARMSTRSSPAAARSSRATAGSPPSTPPAPDLLHPARPAQVIGQQTITKEAEDPAQQRLRVRVVVAEPQPHQPPSPALQGGVISKQGDHRRTTGR